MKIVIDIPEAVYDQICNEKLDGIMARAIRFGRPLPSVQPTQKHDSNTLKALDCVSRQAAIVSITRYFEVHIRNQKSRRLKEHAKEICRDMCFGIDAWPSAQPEIVRCKDCKHRDEEFGFCKGRGWPMQLVPDDGFCDKGKRRTDE